MKKEEAVKIIVDCAKQYRGNLENQNLLFIFGSPQKPESLEAAFLPRHFLHLTGVIPNAGISSTDFYDRCLKGQLKISDFSIPKDGTVEMKLAVLPQLMNLYKTAKMIGDYDFAKSLLYTEKLAGNVTACMGFVREGNYYFPNTALKEDIRDVSKHPQKRVLVIYRKTMKEKTYDQPCYTAKGIDATSLILPDDIKGKFAAPISQTPDIDRLPLRERLKAVQDANKQSTKEGKKKTAKKSTPSL